MAVFHLKVSVGSRSGGQSARAKADYIEREGRYERDREELEHKEHENMPEWAEEDPRSYWEAADEYERANGSLFREITFALPKELNEGQRRELASGFAKRLTEGERLPYTLAIHRGDGENPHAHLMISERANDGIERSREQWFRRYNRQAPEKGGAKKSRAMMSREWVKDTREAWARGTNRALERAGQRRAHRSPQPGRAAGRGGAIRRPAAGGGVEPQAQCPPRPAGVSGRRPGAGGPPGGAKRGFGAGRAGGAGQSRRFGRSGTASSSGSRRSIAGIYQELQALPEKIREAARAGQGVGEEAGSGVGLWREGTRGPGPSGSAELTQKYSHAKGPQISNTPRSPQPTRGREPDRGPSR